MKRPELGAAGEGKESRRRFCNFEGIIYSGGMILCRVFFLGVVSALVAGAQPFEVAPGVLFLGSIQNSEVMESSGLASSRKKGIFWTHNDGGQDIIYATSTNGAPLVQWKIKDVELDNFEDIARSGSQLYIADIGNDTLLRPWVPVYRVPEPNTKYSGEARPSRMWRLAYPDGAFDAEAIFVGKGFGYIIPREPGDGGAQVYRFPLNRGIDVTLEPQFTVAVSGAVTGAALSTDKKRLAVLTSAGAYLFLLPKKMPESGTLEPYRHVPYASSSVEGCAFTLDGLLVTGEDRSILLFTEEAFRDKWKSNQ